MPHASPTDTHVLESVKVCGVTNLEDRNLVADAGADYFGVLVDVGYSPRSLSLEKAEPLFKNPPIPGVVLLFNASPSRITQVAERLKPFAVQLIGNEQPDFLASVKSKLECEVWKSLFLPPRGRGQIDLDLMRNLAEEYEDSGVDALVLATLDPSGGTTPRGGSIVGDWSLMRAIARDRVVPVFLSGGLTPTNVRAAFEAVKPQGIDICTGVEASPGRKDPHLLANLFDVLSVYKG